VRPPLRVHPPAGLTLQAVVADSRGGSMRTNPIVLTDAEIAGIIAACV
jgi:hypothetical protein